ncbi:Soluble hydrogenase 42 kDa subunit [uncultured Clostridium sp.]|uniref:pyridoxal-phosphate-dependent aminotransferase family protein n=1 Tax=uncultured Clostridium sp. TaxID=59620 RepID=UPI000821708F|nr:aminotransferase class V-fold PLP-dependent enzyme [uncultured Clostridium sp.]SCJ41571.1 Soluble hydrogenase 42 kDa subunit [uncultured Clostridium sp.]
MNYYENLNGINFSVGPVQMDTETKLIGFNDLPYFRTEEFSKINKESEMLIKKLVNADDSSRAIFLTTSGTGAMEATVQNLFTDKDKVLIINGGSFGSRFVELCKIHNIQFEELILTTGSQVKIEHLNKFRNKGFTSLIVNIHETSTGVLYDIETLRNFCNEENLLLVVDSISSFLSDPYDMKKNNIDITIIGSQKGLALPPGLSIIVMSERALNKINTNTVKSLYFDLKKYLNDGERGQTPFTPAVGILLQLNEKLKRVNSMGIDYYINKAYELSNYFREQIKYFPFEIASESLSNTVTPLYVRGNMKAHDLFEYLKDNYNIYLCPNGGDLKDKLIRVGHIGNISKIDIDKLINAFCEMKERNLI